ncbi:MAG: hypothetical protein B7Z69_00875 [Actinobacteria bacterium 21-73-9]|nr:MAG: hypothetical protein B7Z69_00875 [Actinobacteria bacterium 21-73-9]
MSTFQIYFFIALVPSIVLHEVSHGYVAYLFGDTTARDAHRLSLNPLRHVDLFGTLLLPALLVLSGLPAFGYAKPVPVNVGRLRRPRQQALWVGLAGPATNVVLSAVGYGICEFAMHVNGSYHLWLFGIAVGLSNLVLAVFNMIPIPPLDGSAVVERFLPVRTLPRYYYWRARMLPILMIVILLDYAVFHVGTTWLGDLENWWISLLR